VCKEVELGEEVELWARSSFRLPPVVVVLLLVGGGGGVAGACTGICIGNPSV
jgi:hypothetical protein